MAKPGKGARQKGANFEREIANLLTDQTGIKFERGLAQTRGGGAEVADITTKHLLPKPLHFELKRQIRCNIKAAYEQALEDAAPDSTHIIVTKSDREPIMVTMEISQWLDFFKSWLAVKE